MMLKAHGKLNLTLDVLGLRPDGYHNLEMLMQTVTLSDTVQVTVQPEAPWQLLCQPGDLPTGPENLAWKAAKAFYAATGLPEPGLQMEITKAIPMEAGMAGGSADAAAVLQLLNRLHGEPLSQRALCQVGERVGSDVPYCVLGGTAWVTGRGENVEPLAPLPPCWFVLCRPDFSISTPALFRALDGCTLTRHPDSAAALQALQAGDLAALGARLYNVFEPLVLQAHPELQQVHQLLRAHGALGSCMTGTGSVFYGLFAQKPQAQAAQAALLTLYPQVWLAQPI